ncbi:GNAT family N-acetyltransferase [Rhizobium sp. LEGMi12c]
MHGYASELVAVALHRADWELRIREVRAFAHTENEASRKILETAGFRTVRFVPEMNRLLLSRPRREDNTAD